MDCGCVHDTHVHHDVCHIVACASHSHKCCCACGSCTHSESITFFLLLFLFLGVCHKGHAYVECHMNGFLHNLVICKICNHQLFIPCSKNLRVTTLVSIHSFWLTCIAVHIHVSDTWSELLSSTTNSQAPESASVLHMV